MDNSDYEEVYRNLIEVKKNNLDILRKRIEHYEVRSRRIIDKTSQEISETAMQNTIFDNEIREKK
jgi:hypothetical protein